MQIMHTPNDELIATITQKIAALQQIEELLATVDFQTYITRYNQFKQAFSHKGYKIQTWNLLFDNFDFASNPRDPRTTMLRAVLELHAEQPDISGSPSFHRLLCVNFQNIHQHKTTDFPGCQQLRNLIDLQITSLQQRIVAATNPVTEQPAGALSPILDEDGQPKPQSSPYCLSRNKTIAVVGFGIIGISLLLHLNSSFALLVGIHLSPAMFVVLVVAGACMAGYGISRKEQPNAPPAIRPAAASWQPPFYGQQIEQILKFCFKFGRTGAYNLPNNSSTNLRQGEISQESREYKWPSFALG
jgi:hypothetical protein